MEKKITELELATISYSKIIQTAYYGLKNIQDCIAVTPKVFLRSTPSQKLLRE